jgi:tetratricopeptide (TPR) repeat protein
MSPLLVPILCTLGDAAAASPPPDYREELREAVAHRVEALGAQGDLPAALDLAARFERRIGPSAAVAYEAGLLANRAGDAAAALRWYDRALSADPGHAAARYDRGELHLRAGRLDAAQADFEAAAAARPDAWAVHFRLAELGAHRADPAAFDRHLADALRHGFDFREVATDPNWQSWARDPLLSPVLARYILVYSDPRILDTLQGEP